MHVLFKKKLYINTEGRSEYVRKPTRFSHHTPFGKRIQPI